MRFWTPATVIGLLAVGFCRATVPVNGDAEAEDELKSVIVKNFIRYSTWPDPALAGGPITIGVLGHSSFTQTLHNVLDGKPVNGRLIQVVQLKSSSDLHHCHLVYFANDRSADTKQLLQTLHSGHILTIGEGDRFLDYGGAVKLLLVDGHMGFEVSLDALDRAGIEISSKLLRLGQIKRRHEE